MPHDNHGPRSGNANTEFETLWRSAEQLASEQPEHELTLARLASKWELEKESEELWWRVAENPSDATRGAGGASAALSRRRIETAKLYDVLQRLHESSPERGADHSGSRPARLNMGQNTERSHQLAKEAYDRAPNEVNCALTYAFSLSRLGKNAEAVAIVESLPPEQLHDPHAAVYVALLLAQAGQIEAANNYIATADDGKIYPEEEKLLDEAKTNLATATATPSPMISAVPAELSPTPTASPR